MVQYSNIYELPSTKKKKKKKKKWNRNKTKQRPYPFPTLVMGSVIVMVREEMEQK